MSPKELTKFKASLKEAGAELLGPTNPYEVLRFSTRLGVGVVYSGKRGESWNEAAVAARDHLAGGKTSLAPVTVHGRRKSKGTVSALVERDGDNCFFCGLALESDVTVEHLVAVAHGGPNHVSNLFLAHFKCNDAAGHLSAPEKIAMAIRQRSTGGAA